MALKKNPDAFVNELVSKLRGIDGYATHGFVRITPLARMHGLSRSEGLDAARRASVAFDLTIDRHGNCGWCATLAR